MKQLLVTSTKSLMAGAVAFAGAVAVGQVEGGMTDAEWWVAIAAGLSALSAVWGVRPDVRDYFTRRP